MKKYQYGFKFGKRRTLTKGLYFVINDIFQQVKNSILRGDIDAQDVRHMKLQIQQIPASDNSNFNQRNTSYRILLKGAGHQYVGALNKFDKRDRGLYTYFVGIVPKELNEAFGYTDKAGNYHTNIDGADFMAVVNTYGYLKNCFRNPQSEYEQEHLLMQVHHLNEVMLEFKRHLVYWADLIQKQVAKRQPDNDVPELVKTMRKRFAFDLARKPYKTRDEQITIYDLLKDGLDLCLGFDETGKLNTFLITGDISQDLYPDLMKCVENVMFGRREKKAQI